MNDIKETVKLENNAEVDSSLAVDFKSWPSISSTVMVVVAWWTISIIVVLCWHLRDVSRNAFKVAHISAVQSFEKDVVYRRWSAMHGGVYVPVTEHTPPNPYLSHLPHRDITTDWGAEYTLMNPAYMTRQVHELGHEQYGYQGHITSLDPIRPKNAPDAWEIAALRGFEKGEIESVEMSKIGDVEYLRMMRPLTTESGCLKCHAGQGYKVGDIRGGISVSIPMASLQVVMRDEMSSIIIGYTLLWILGLVGIGFGAKRMGSDMREREHMEDILKAREARFKGMFDNMSSGVAIYRAIDNGADFVFVDFNSAGESIDSISRKDLIGRPVTEVFPGIEKFGLLDVFRRVWQTEEPESHPVSVYNDGHISRWRENYVYKIPTGEIIAVYDDVTERKLTEEHLQQTQKMESIGQLAGGVAHDFNNLLMGIMGYTDLCRNSIKKDDPINEWLGEITRSSERTAGVVEKLLAFSRKQTASPKVIDINDAVSEILKMLIQLIGEDISIGWQPDKNLWKVKMDLSQIDQILTNICINARDAIGGVGSITIEAKNRVCGVDDCATNEEAEEGEYVMLSIRDTGTGINHDTISHIFNPFFTTKGMGKGTGLGLSTVYGIVQQNGGFITVSSELGSGTTFRVYLPRAIGVNEEKTADKPDAAIGGRENILLVEDEKSIRVTLKIFLQEFGYSVLAAESPADALLKVEERGSGIDLLITDVVMPGMNGRELADKLCGDFPELKVLYMSGYTANVIEYKGVIDKNMNFISKPFSREVIAQKVREILDDTAF